MKQNIAHVAVVVNDYDEAIDFYTKKLNFIIVEDTKLSESKRWVIVAPQGSKDICTAFFGTLYSLRHNSWQ